MGACCSKKGQKAKSSISKYQEGETNPQQSDELHIKATDDDNLSTQINQISKSTRKIFIEASSLTDAGAESLARSLRVMEYP
mmetsp:Transcript_32686/g.29555  ORF Transcript_32686/g.29555 Transcript_32686/m.29555 type:complete len:82 (+) Transcript_32686:44-289(+)